MQGLIGVTPGVVIRKFGEGLSKILPVGLFFHKYIEVIALCLTKPPHLLQLCKHIRQKNCAQMTSSYFPLLFLAL